LSGGRNDGDGCFPGGRFADRGRGGRRADTLGPGREMSDSEKDDQDGHRAKESHESIHITSRALADAQFRGGPGTS
jgi:hypothetical protein